MADRDPDPQDSPAIELERVTEQREICRALVLALDRTPDVIAVLESSTSEDSALGALSELLGVDAIGARAIGDLQFRRVIGRGARLRERLQELERTCDELAAVVARDRPGA
jgi:DNA gyrase/topoisomerase IV subunit A